VLSTVHDFWTVVAGDRGAEERAAGELAYMERNSDAFRACLEG
jgi:hypothetical protein